MQKAQFALFAAVLIFCARPVFAAETFFEVKNPDLQAGNAFEASFFLNTEDEDINAIEGTVAFPADLLEVKEIRDGNSIINFWIKRPSAGVGEITFAGIIPGGYLDKKGLMFSVLFQPSRAGQGSIQARGMQVLLNDGKGTAAGMSAQALPISVAPQTTPMPAPERRDVDKPEVFEPTIASDPTLFDGKYFLVFATQDKGSGIDHYEVREGNDPFVEAESPYLLHNQQRNEDIFVKAVDRSGNERVAVLVLNKKMSSFQKYAALGIMFVLVFVIGWVLSRKYLRKK